MAVYRIVCGSAADASRRERDGIVVNCNGRNYKTSISAVDFLGYIPGLSCLIGLARMTLGSIVCCVAPSWGGYQIARGVVELCCLDLVFLPYDLGAIGFQRIE